MSVAWQARRTRTPPLSGSLPIGSRRGASESLRSDPTPPLSVYPRALPPSAQRLVFIDGAPHARLQVEIDSAAAFSGVPDDSDSANDSANDSATPAYATHALLAKLSLGVGGAALVLTREAASRIGLLESTAALQPTGVLAGPGEGQVRLQRIQEGALATGRVRAVQLPSARFERARCVVHAEGAGPAGAATSASASALATATAPRDLELSQGVDGVLGADLLRG